MILPSLQQSSSPRTWLFYGDSITHGVLHTAGARCFSEHFTERLRFELERPDDVVLNTACSGHNTRQMLSPFPQRVARFKPDVVLDHHNEPALITRVVSTYIVPYAEVTAEYAAIEGEGDGSLEYWRQAHWGFFARACEQLGRQPAESMPVVCCVFEVLHILPLPVAA